jgi:hypothetical protein
MIQAIAYALTLLTTQPVFCNETLVWDDGRKCQVTVGAIYLKENGDVYTLSSEPFEFEGCRSKRPR